MISWMGLRGAVPIVLATYTLTAQVTKSHLIFDIVFFVVLVSTLIQGFTLRPFSRWLKVSIPEKNKYRFPFEYAAEGENQSELREVEVPHDSALVGKSIAEANLPPNLLIVLLKRGMDVFAPRGGTIFHGGDTL